MIAKSLSQTWACNVGYVRSGPRNSLLSAGLTLKLAFFPDAVSGTSIGVNKQKKDDNLL